MPSAAKLTSHLKSPRHSQDAVFCPSCLRFFYGATALAQHVESQASRCRVRDSNNYRTFVDQLTAGLVDVDGRHVDNTVRYVVPETDSMFQEETGEEGYKENTEEIVQKKKVPQKQKSYKW